MINNLPCNFIFSNSLHFSNYHKFASTFYCDSANIVHLNNLKTNKQQTVTTDTVLTNISDSCFNYGENNNKKQTETTKPQKQTNNKKQNNNMS